MNSGTIPSKYISKKWLEFHPYLPHPIAKYATYCLFAENTLINLMYKFIPSTSIHVNNAVWKKYWKTVTVEHRACKTKQITANDAIVRSHWFIRNSVTAATTFSFCLLKLKFNWKGITSEKCYLFEAEFSKFCTYHMIPSGCKQVLVQDKQKISKTQGQQEILVNK